MQQDQHSNLSPLVSKTNRKTNKDLKSNGNSTKHNLRSNKGNVKEQCANKVLPENVYFNEQRATGHGRVKSKIVVPAVERNAGKEVADLNDNIITENEIMDFDDDGALPARGGDNILLTVYASDDEFQLEDEECEKVVEVPACDHDQSHSNVSTPNQFRRVIERDRQSAPSEDSEIQFSKSARRYRQMQEMKKDPDVQRNELIKQ